MSKIEEVKAKVEAGKSKLVPGLVQEALDEGSSPSEILQAMVDSMSVVGDKFSSGEIFVPEMLIAAKAMSKGVEVLKPLMAGDGSTSWEPALSEPLPAIFTTSEKNLVSMMIESAGFDMVDLGVDVPADTFVKAVKDNSNVKLVACSGLLTTTMPALKEAVQTIKAAYPDLKVIVGGAPVTPEYATEVGADGYAPDAGSAAVKAKELATA